MLEGTFTEVVRALNGGEFCQWPARVLCPDDSDALMRDYGVCVDVRNNLRFYNLPSLPAAPCLGPTSPPPRGTGPPEVHRMFWGRGRGNVEYVFWMYPLAFRAKLIPQAGNGVYDLGRDACAAARDVEMCEPACAHTAGYYPNAPSPDQAPDQAPSPDPAPAPSPARTPVNPRNTKMKARPKKKNTRAPANLVTPVAYACSRVRRSHARPKKLLF